MIRENFAATYQKIAKDYKANVVPELNTALKNIDKEKDAGKLPGLITKADSQLSKAIKEIKELQGSAQSSKVKDLAGKMQEALSKLRERLSKFEDDTKSGKGGDMGPSTADVKDSVEAGRTLSKLDDDIGKDLIEFGRGRVALWTQITKLGEKRWKCIKNYCKSQGVSANGFRSFPTAIDIMVDECKNANPSAGKARKGGSSQTILVEDDDNASETDVRADFIKYSAAEIKGELRTTLDMVKKLDTKLEQITKNVDKLSAGADKMRQEAKDLGKSDTANKITSESTKLKSFASNFKSSAKKADDAINALYKIIDDKDGLGGSDGDIRDAYLDIPKLETMNKDIKSAVDHLEGYMKDIQKKKP
ncbi:MAG: hypothetical protein IT168_04920 [Bryobacterales bacterium]|nr:hypothetical protein [Bryobacterales bacterium]